MTARTPSKAAPKTAPKAAENTAPEPEPAPEEATEGEHYPSAASALAAFQRRLPRVAKGNTGTIPGREGRSGYSYDYADLTDVSEVILPLLGQVGLIWHTGLDTEDAGRIVLRWELTHGDTGQGWKGTLPIGAAGANWQNLGSSITYARRYALCAATGVAPGGDDDDAAASVAGHNPNGPAQRQAPAQSPVVPKAERLPAGLYDLSTLTDVEAVRDVFRKARSAGHLGLLIGVTDADGNVSEMAFGEYLTKAGEALTPAPDEAPEPPEDTDPDAAAIRAHEESITADEARAAAEELPSRREDPTAENN